MSCVFYPFSFFIFEIQFPIEENGFEQWLIANITLNFNRRKCSQFALSGGEGLHGNSAVGNIEYRKLPISPVSMGSSHVLNPKINFFFCSYFFISRLFFVNDKINYRKCIWIDCSELRPKDAKRWTAEILLFITEDAFWMIEFRFLKIFHYHIFFR